MGEGEGAAPNWREDDGRGELRAAVECFLGDAVEMTAHDIALVRVFLRRSMDAGHHGMCASMADVLRTQVDDIASRHDIERWLDRAAGEGIDPL